MNCIIKVSMTITVLLVIMHAFGLQINETPSQLDKIALIHVSYVSMQER